MTKYILDTNVYIEAHNKYYHPDIVLSYWDILKGLGVKDVIKSPKQVRDELKSPWLAAWKRENKIFLDKDLDGIMPFFNQVRGEYKKVKAANNAELLRLKPTYVPSREEPLSGPDMFVIATVLFYKANFPNTDFVLVTKENFTINVYKSVRIPHLCVPLGIRYIDDFQFLKEAGVTFVASCS